MGGTALLVIDLIKDICHPEGKVARCAPYISSHGTISSVNRAICHSRQHGWLTIFVKVGFSTNYVDHPKNSPLFSGAHKIGALDMNGSGTEFHPELKVEFADIIIHKPRISSFYATSLDAVLRANKIERLIIAGVSTSWAIQSVAREAHDRDYDVVILQDACADIDEYAHTLSIDMLKSIARITNVKDLIHADI